MNEKNNVNLKNNAFQISAYLPVHLLVIVMIIGVAGCGNADNDRSDLAQSQRSGGASTETAEGSVPALLSEVSLTTDRSSTHHFGEKAITLFGEQCEYSGREIRSKRYGAVTVDEDGRVQRYRSVESLVWHMAEQDRDPDTYPFVGIVDFVSAEQIMPPDELMYHHSKLLPSPGGSWVSAMDPESDKDLLFNIGEAYPGTRYTWDEIREVLLDEKYSQQAGM